MRESNKITARFRIEYHDRRVDPIFDIEETEGLNNVDIQINGNLEYEGNNYIVKDIMVEISQDYDHKEYNMFVTVYVIDAP